MTDQLNPTHLNPDAVLTPEQVALARPALSMNYLQKLRMSGKGPHYFKPSHRRVVYRLGDVDAWLETSRVSSTSECR